MFPCPELVTRPNIVLQLSSRAVDSLFVHLGSREYSQQTRYIADIVESLLGDKVATYLSMTYIIIITVQSPISDIVVKLWATG